MSVSDLHRPLLRLGRVLAVVSLSLLLASCTSEKDHLDAIAKTAATSRAAAATALRNAFYAKTITANGAIDLAYQGVDGALPPPGGTAPRAPTPADIAFAGAVLDFIDQAEPDIDKKVANDLFWIRVGTLAGNAAAAAKAANDLPSARSLVLAGPQRWQNDAYWRQCPGHDALASLILFESGEGKEALSRLNDRPDLAEDVLAAKTMIEKEMKRGKGRK